jgi:type IV secretion system protein VirB10
MTAEPQGPAWGPETNATPAATDGVSAVSGIRPRLTGGQKLGILAGAGAVALAAIVLTHLPGGGAKNSDLKQDAGGIGALGIPFSAPVDKHTPPNPVPASSPLSPPQAPPLMATLLNHQETPAERALKAPILAYGSASGAPAPPSSPASAIGGEVNLHGKRATADDPLARDLTPSDVGAAANARLLPHPDYTIAAGTIIPCTLQTAIDSGLPGFVKCVLPQAVRSMTGRVTLLDRGTQVLGEIRSGLVQGQDRLFILWTRAVTPKNVAIALASPAADQLGRAGVTGAVDYHFWRRFGAAIMLTVIGGSLQAGANAVQNGNGNSYFEYLAPNTNQIANTALEATINIPPTLKKNQGDNVSIFVARDLNFYRVYKLELAAPPDPAGSRP